MRDYGDVTYTRMPIIDWLCIDGILYPVPYIMHRSKFPNVFFIAR